MYLVSLLVGDNVLWELMPLSVSGQYVGGGDVLCGNCCHGVYLVSMLVGEMYCVGIDIIECI